MKVVLLGLVLALLAIMFTAATMQRHTVAAIENKAAPRAALATSQRAVAQHVISPKQRLAVAFRLDPALTRSLYLGDRWVSPPSFYFAQPGTQYVVQAKLQAIDSRGERIDLSGDWTTNDPEMIAPAMIMAKSRSLSVAPARAT
ncbi:MAG TPA: hypothetical protein VJ484_11120 [Lysobacter sp.]|nr:hypothetical protein [Lysobacter sp.]